MDLSFYKQKEYTNNHKAERFQTFDQNFHD